jgi:hypothetical protein
MEIHFCKSLAFEFIRFYPTLSVAKSKSLLPVRAFNLNTPPTALSQPLFLPVPIVYLCGFTAILLLCPSHFT